MAAGSWIVYTTAKEYIGDNTLDLDLTTGTGWKVALVTSGYTPALTHNLFATAAIATALATNGGDTNQSLGTVTWAATGTSIKWNAGVTGVQWTASGGTMSAAYAIIYADYQTSPVDPVVCYVDLDTGGGNIDVSSGNTLTLDLSNAIFTLGGATS